VNTRSAMTMALVAPRRRVFWLFVAVLPGLVWWLAFLPAVMTPDSMAIWGAVLAGEPLPVMPYTYWLFVSTLSLGGRTLGLLTLLQAVGLGLAIVYVSRSIGLTSRSACLISAVVMTTPFGGLFAVTLWKDVPATIAMLLGAGALAQWISGRGSERLLACGCGALVVAGLLRFETPLVLCVVGLCILVLSVLGEPNVRRRIVAVGCLVLLAGIASLLMATIAQSALVGRSLPSWNKWIPGIADLAYIAAMEPNDQRESLSAARQIVSGEALRAAEDCSQHATMFYSDGFNPGLAAEWESRIPMWLLEASVTYPHRTVEAHLCRGAPFLPPPFASSAGPSPVWGGTSIVQPNDFGLEFANPLAVRTPFIAWNALWNARASVVGWPGLLALLGSLSLVALGRWRPQRGRRLVLAGFMWGPLLPFAAWTVLSDFRYVATVQILGVVAILSWVATVATRGACLENEIGTGEDEGRHLSATTINSP